MKDVLEELYQTIKDKGLTSTSREQYAIHKASALCTQVNPFPPTTSLIDQAVMWLQNHQTGGVITAPMPANSANNITYRVSLLYSYLKDMQATHILRVESSIAISSHLVNLVQTLGVQDSTEVDTFAVGTSTQHVDRVFASNFVKLDRDRTVKVNSEAPSRPSAECKLAPPCLKKGA